MFYRLVWNSIIFLTLISGNYIFAILFVVFGIFFWENFFEAIFWALMLDFIFGFEKNSFKYTLCFTFFLIIFNWLKNKILYV